MEVEVIVKNPGAIRHKLNQVRFRHLCRYLEENLSQTPCNCKFNAALPKRGDREALNICLYGAQDPLTWKSSYCDDRLDQGDRAKKCGWFVPRIPKEELKENFADDLTQMKLSEVAYHYPDLAALLWVLDAEDLAVEDISEAEVQPLTVQEESSLPLGEGDPDPLPDMPKSDLLTVEDATKKTPWYARWIP